MIEKERDDESGKDLQLAVTTFGVSDSHILPGQLASNPDWFLACGCKCYSGASQGLCDPSYGRLGPVLRRGWRGDALLGSVPRLAPALSTKASFGGYAMAAAGRLRRRLWMGAS